MPTLIEKPTRIWEITTAKQAARYQPCPPAATDRRAGGGRPQS
jgi:hypothetical protein